MAGQTIRILRILGHQRDDRSASRTKQVYQTGFNITTKRLNVDPMNAVCVLRSFVTNQHGAHIASSTRPAKAGHYVHSSLPSRSSRHRGYGASRYSDVSVATYSAPSLPSDTTRTGPI